MEEIKRSGTDNSEVKKGRISVLTIYVNQDNGGKVEVEGLIADKKFVFNVIGEAIKAIANFEAPIVQPVHRVIPRIKNMFRH